MFVIVASDGSPPCICRRVSLMYYYLRERVLWAASGAAHVPMYWPVNQGYSLFPLKRFVSYFNLLLLVRCLFGTNLLQQDFQFCYSSIPLTWNKQKTKTVDRKHRNLICFRGWIYLFLLSLILLFQVHFPSCDSLIVSPSRVLPCSVLLNFFVFSYLLGIHSSPLCSKLSCYCWLCLEKLVLRESWLNCVLSEEWEFTALQKL